ncbi:cyclin, N-terminal domain protein [Pelomyxa schiedti]|nr:cyclin, N-terminal domain protein [Pelomyxa schiedti]
METMESPLYMQVSTLMGRLIEAQRSFVPEEGTQEPTAFDAIRVPGITLEAYVKRLEVFSGCSRSTLLAAMVFIDRILERNPTFFLTERNAHRLLLSCLVTALKFYEDNFYSNKFYARVGGVSMLEMNTLEVALLKMIQFDLYITPEQFLQYSQAIATIAVPTIAEQTQTPALECVTPPGSPSPSNTPASVTYIPTPVTSPNSPPPPPITESPESFPTSEPHQFLPEECSYSAIQYTTPQSQSQSHNSHRHKRTHRCPYPTPVVAISTLPKVPRVSGAHHFMHTKFPGQEQHPLPVEFPSQPAHTSQPLMMCF